MPHTETRDQLVLCHEPLVKRLAGRLAYRLPRQVEFQELVSVGMLGLIDAAGRYQPSFGVPFEAFARQRIHGAMLDALRGMDWAPRSLRRLRRQVDAAISQLRHTLGREPEASEIARALDVSETEYARCLARIRTPELTNSRHTNVRSEMEELDMTVDTSEGPHARLEQKEMRELLTTAVSQLPERERHILALYYHAELTLAQIGGVIGVGESRVSQLRTQAIGRLRANLNAGAGDARQRSKEQHCPPAPLPRGEQRSRTRRSLNADHCRRSHGHSNRSGQQGHSVAYHREQQAA